MQTDDFDELVAWSRDLLGNSTLVETWIPRAKFISASRDGDCFTIAREDNGIYGFAFGARPVIPDNWNRFSANRVAEPLLLDSYKKNSNWDTYVKELSPIISEDRSPVNAGDDAEIREFLMLHAPESSVMPGNPEIQGWAQVRHENQLVGVAALCRWESGRYVVASVAVDSGKRNLGIGKAVMSEIERIAINLGIDQLCLGVMAANVSAKRLYEKQGYRLLHAFTSFESLS